MKLGVTLDILNQKATPAFYADTLANRPAAGFTGRVFISTDTLNLYRDTGTTWELLSPSSAGTISGGGAAGQVTYFVAPSSISGDNNLFWDNVNGHLGINTNTPSTALTIFHDQNQIVQLNQTTATNDTKIAFQNSGTPLWRIGNSYNGGENDYAIYDVIGAIQPFTVKKTTGQVLIGTTTVGAGKLVVSSAASDNGIQIVGANAPSLRLDNAVTGATKRVGLGIATAVNNFIQGSADRNFCIFNGSTTASPILFGIYDAGTVNVQEAGRISPARNFLIGTTTDNGLKLQVSGSSSITGGLGIGTSSLNGRNILIDRILTGTTTSISVFNTSVIASDVTTLASSFRSSPQTQTAAFTLATLAHFQATNATIGAGSSVTTQVGYQVTSITSATNNYGFQGQLASGTGRFNLFMDGTAGNYLAGDTGIGISSSYVSSGPILTTTLTNGGSGYVDGTYTDVASSNISSTGNNALFTIVISGGIVTTATLTWGGIYYKANDTLTISNTLLGGTGSGLIITVNTVNSSSFIIANTNGADISLVRSDTGLSAGENLGTIKWLSNDTTAKASGIQAEISAFGASTNGGAYLTFSTRSATAGTSLVEAMRIDFRSIVGIGTGASINASAKLQIDSTTQGFLPPRMTLAQKNAIASPAEGLIIYQTDGTAGLYIYSGAAWKMFTIL